MLYAPEPEGTYRVSQKFGERPAYYQKYGLAAHNGIDLSPLVRGRTDMYVFAPHEGYVTLLDEGGVGYGRHVEILGRPYDNAGNRRKSVLAHLQSYLVQNGQYVGSGDPVGIMGRTGDADGVHVHFTYKIADVQGNTLNKNNGYLGALDVSKYTLLWRRMTL